MSTKATMADQVSEAMAKAQALYIDVLVAEKELNDTAAASAKKIETAQVAFTKVRDAQNVLSQEASEALKTATAALLAYQGQASTDLGITIDVLPKQGGGSTRL